MDPRLFHKRLSDATRDLIPRGSGIVCGVSGGGDSMALLHGLHAVNEIHDRGWALHVAHLDHGLSRGSADHAQFVGRAAAGLGLGCTIETFDVRAAAQAGGETVEEAGRRVRYQFLEKTARSAGAGLVAVGHQADDQAETVLHHIVRGTGLRGLGGMRERRPIHDGSDVALVRPLLGFHRSELRAYLVRRELSCCEDPTNEEEDASMRNRIRRRVMPLLAEAANPEIARALVRLSDHARQMEETLTFFSAEVLNRVRIRQGADEMVLSAETLSGYPKSIRTEVILSVLRGLGVGLKEIGQERIEAVDAALVGNGKRRIVELPGAVTVERRGRELRIRSG